MGLRIKLEAKQIFSGTVFMELYIISNFRHTLSNMVVGHLAHAGPSSGPPLTENWPTTL